ncbi:MAG: acylase, partial [Candidatus Solibacter usitatus]|nr:acylase [Candidatus Solibacter usitatus]
MSNIKGPLLLTLAAALSAAPAPKTEILWDTYGVPHIFAADDESLFRAFGWAQAESHGNLILRLYGQARGRGAEYWGEKYAEDDRWVRLNGVPARARQWVERQPAPFRPNLDAFAAGINAYVKENPGRIGEDVKVVLPVDAIDVLAHVQRVIHFSFVTRRLGAPELQRMWQPEPPGSNAWAIGPKRAAGGKAMLLGNPHLPWSDFFLFYESQLTAPGVNAYGAALVGFPVLGIAFNDSLGWTHTVNTYDGQDHYELTLADGGYRFDGQVRPFETEEQILKVKGKPDEKLVVRRSVHGPVLTERAGKALALRVAGLDQPGLCQQWWDMARARSLEEFTTALRRLQIPMFTVMYADRDGHILHLFGGRTPVRPRGDWNYWSRSVPGDTTATLWTSTHPYEDLPRVLDPPSGWLQNANDPPWTTTFPAVLDPNKFPPYMAPRAMPFRPQRSARMLDEDPSITFDEMVLYKHSTRMEMADRILDDLIRAAREHGNDDARRAAATLAAWDRSARADSRGAVLFESFVREWLTRTRGKMFAVPWS